MDFKDWIKRFEKMDTPRGDLADDIVRDRNLPTENSLQAWLDHLYVRGACPGAKAVLRSAWKRYEKEQPNHART